jgi:DNA replicative helicase MCM subunit Mcm2 (Cdc46/Mcm family)
VLAAWGRLGWGPGAEEIYDAVRQGVEREIDERRRELFWRSAEKTVRIATIGAASCLSKTVNRDHMEWAYELVKRSDETLLVGVQEYMEEEKYEFAELCREMIRRMRQSGGGMSGRDIGRSFQNNLKFGPELKRAIDHLVGTEQVIEQKVETGGRPSIWYQLPPREKPKK